MADRSQIAELVGGPGRVRPTGYRGTVARDVASADDLMLVNVESFDQNLPFAARWNERPGDGLPLQGLPCIVLVDENGEAWVPVWWPHGD